MRQIFVVLLAMFTSLVSAAPALAQTPDWQRDVASHSVVADADVCGDYGVLWDINLTADIADFFDADGIRLRRVFHVQEDNTITRIDLAGNPVPGTTLREGPDSFTQTVYFNPDGTVNQIVATGLSARVGNDLRDVGRVVLLPLGGGRYELAFSAGQHPLREAASGGPIVAGALAGFCEVLG